MSSRSAGQFFIQSVGETIICGVDDTEDDDEVGVRADGGDPISIVCTKSSRERRARMLLL